MEHMEPMELTEHLELLVRVPANYFLYPCGGRTTGFMEVGIIKPLDKLAKFGYDRDDLIIWSRVKRLKVQTPQSVRVHPHLVIVILSVLGLYFSPGLLR